MLNTQQLHPVVLSYDPAIDVGKVIENTAGFNRYIAERKWSDIEPFLRPGVEPQKFYLRLMTHAELVACGNSKTTDSALLAFRYAVERVDNARTRDGATVARLQPANQKQFSEAELQEFWHMSAIAEIGSVALTRSFFDPAIGMPCELPHTSLAILKRLISRHAEPSTPTASSGLSKPSTDAALPTTVTSVEPSERPGTAAATG